MIGRRLLLPAMAPFMLAACDERLEGEFGFQVRSALAWRHPQGDGFVVVSQRKGGTCSSLHEEATCDTLREGLRREGWPLSGRAFLDFGSRSVLWATDRWVEDRNDLPDVVTFNGPLLVECPRAAVVNHLTQPATLTLLPADADVAHVSLTDNSISLDLELPLCEFDW